MKHHPVTHEGGGVDTRYSIEKEFTGKAQPQFVARFCGEFIGSSQFLSAMQLRCVGHNMLRKGGQPIVEKRQA